MTYEGYIIELQRPQGDWVPVGELVTDGVTNEFRSLPSYWALADRPVLGQAFEDKPEDWRPRASVALPKWFSHLLPEGQLRNAVSRASAISATREFPLLGILGADDLPGAIRVLPSDSSSGEITATDNQYDDEQDTDSPVLKFSLAGLQMKFSMHADNRGLTLPAKGTAGNIIVKLPDLRPGFEGVPESEYAAMTLAASAGLRVPDVQLVDTDSIEGIEDWYTPGTGPSFIVERFDRKKDGTRVHAEELAQVLAIPTTPTAKYSRANFETIANLVGALAGVKAVGEVIDRIVFNTLIGNGDAHLKNWAIIYPDGQTPSLSPTYDVVPTVLYLSDDNLGLNLAGSKEFRSVTANSFRRLGERSGIGGDAAVTRAIDAAERVVEVWPTLRDLLTAAQFGFLDRRFRDLQIIRNL